LNLTFEMNAIAKLANETIANQTIDTYFLSLVAATLYNVKRVDEARSFADIVAKF